MNGVELLGRWLRYNPVAVTTPDKLRIAAQDWGEPGRGRDVLLIHGFSQANLCWFNQVTGPLARQYRLVTYDLRGHGASEKPSDPAHYREPERWAGEVQAVIETVGLRKPVIVAWSYAGRIALDFLSHAGPDAISGLVLVAGTSTVEPWVLGPGTPALRRMAAARDLAENVAATRDFLALCVASPLDPPAREVLLACNLAVPLFVRVAMGGRPADYDALLARLSFPVLAIHGACDRINLPTMAEHTARICPHGRMLIYDNVGHMPFWEAASRFDADLADFLAALDESAGAG